jgi:hypothetical protein
MAKSIWINLHCEKRSFSSFFYLILGIFLFSISKNVNFISLYPILMKQILPRILNIKKIYDLIMPLGKILEDFDKHHRFNDSNLNIPKVTPQIKEVLALTGILAWMFLIKYLLDFLGVFGEIMFFLFIPLSAFSHIIGEIDEFNKNERKKEINFPTNRIIEIFLLQIIYIGFAFFSLRGFIGHTILADVVAEDIGWLTGSPFQTELAFYHLGVGFMAMICLWKRDSIWIGLIYSKSIFLFGASGVHIWDIIAN